MMHSFFLVGYKVKGIKSLDHLVSLSFYKKTITMPIETQSYNIKGIYGINGSGKSAIIASVDILKNLLTNPDYLNNPIVQNHLDAFINKTSKELKIEVDFLARMPDFSFLYNYKVVLKKDKFKKYIIDFEKLSFKKANSKKDDITSLIEIDNGEVVQVYEKDTDKAKDFFIKKTSNLLTNSTASSLFVDKILYSNDYKQQDKSWLYVGFLVLNGFGRNLYVYIDQSDSHINYFLRSMMQYSGRSIDDTDIQSYLQNYLKMGVSQLKTLSFDDNYVLKDVYDDFAKTVRQLQDFIQVFKSDLSCIEIERKEDGDVYVCSLNMVYESYSINAEFESTGIKKLITLFNYLQKMVEGGIVFIDEFDSNLHDVYLCALIEYLMDYAKGQLCFTTHNVGPMDILKSRKKSIDFLSEDGNIYPWTKNGNYSPSKLYKSGMIEGSPFNVESIDFIGVFDQKSEVES